MKAFVVQDSEDINVDPGDKPVLQTQGTTSPWPLKLLFFSGSSVPKLGKGEATYDMWRHKMHESKRSF